MRCLKSVYRGKLLLNRKTSATTKVVERLRRLLYACTKEAKCPNWSRSLITMTRGYPWHPLCVRSSHMDRLVRLHLYGNFACIERFLIYHNFALAKLLIALFPLIAFCDEFLDKCIDERRHRHSKENAHNAAHVTCHNNGNKH